MIVTSKYLSCPNSSTKTFHSLYADLEIIKSYIIDLSFFQFDNWRTTICSQYICVAFDYIRVNELLSGIRNIRQQTLGLP